MNQLRFFLTGQDIHEAYIESSIGDPERIRTMREQGNSPGNTEWESVKPFYKACYERMAQLLNQKLGGDATTNN